MGTSFSIKLGLAGLFDQLGLLNCCSGFRSGFSATTSSTPTSPPRWGPSSKSSLPVGAPYFRPSLIVGRWAPAKVSPSVEPGASALVFEEDSRLVPDASKARRLDLPARVLVFKWHSPRGQEHYVPTAGVNKTPRIRKTFEWFPTSPELFGVSVKTSFG